jgi:hypothetical protein
MKITARLFLKWTLLVTLNALASFAAAVLTDFSNATALVAMAFGIATFIVLYTCIEGWAIARGRDDLRKSLKVGVIVKMILQLLPGIELGAGYVATRFLAGAGLAAKEGDEPGFLFTYLSTLIVGLLLSVIVFVIAALYWHVHDRIQAAARRRGAA